MTATSPTPTPAATPTAPEEVGRLLPPLAMVAVIVFWGMGPPISKLISAPPLVTVFFRLWFSAPLLFLGVILTGGRVDRRLLARTALPGILFGANLAFVFASFHHATIAVISVINAMQPGVVLVAAGRLFGERPTRWHLAFTGVGVAGTVVVILGSGGKVHTSGLGVGLAVLSMLTFTAYFLATKRARAGLADISALEWMAGVTLFGALTVSPFTIATASRADYAAVNGHDWIWLAFAVLMTGIGGHVLMSWVHRYIQASRSSLYLLAMNVVAIGAAWPIHHEPITVVQAIGGAIVLGAVAAVVRRPPIRVADLRSTDVGGAAGQPATAT